MYQAPRGTFDIFGSEYLLRQDVVDTLFDVVSLYGFSPIMTPIFEEEELFIRSVGDSSDIVNKEIYQFNDKKGRKLALRPELTAPIMRSYIENKMYAQDPFKRLCYYGPNFRYERPQAGRFRQFYQFGVESIGYKDANYDAQIILMALHILYQLNITSTVLHINTLGNNEERKAYNQALKDYFSQYQDQLCSDCQNRINNNPLRILDCKVDGASEIINNAPQLKDFLGEESLNYYQTIKDILDTYNIKYVDDPSLVRGLDYYNDIVFEIKDDADQAKNTLIGGGRYDHLCSELGGPEMPSIGFAIGIERLLDTIKRNQENILDDYKTEVDVYFSISNQEERNQAYPLMLQLRDGLIVDCNYNDRSYKKNLQTAIKLNAMYLVSFNEDKLIIRNLETKEEQEIDIKDFNPEIFNN